MTINNCIKYVLLQWDETSNGLLDLEVNVNYSVICKQSLVDVFQV